jgi:hypothetical protein
MPDRMILMQIYYITGGLDPNSAVSNSFVAISMSAVPYGKGWFCWFHGLMMFINAFKGSLSQSL